MRESDLVRRLVLVSGAPGAGKTTLGRPLAAALGMPFISKDVIKESLFDALGHVADDQLESSRRLGGAAMELLWRLAGECPAAVLEANFRSHSDYERDRITELCEHPVEVYCRVPLEVASTRYSERGARSEHHEVHVLRSITSDALAEFESPFDLGPVIEVDTTAAVDIHALADRVLAALDQVS